LREAVHGTPSYHDLAAVLDHANLASISKQAIWKRLTDCFIDLMKRLLAMVMEGQAAVAKPFPGKTFMRVLIQDSTIIRLPARLFATFGGVANDGSRVCNARIQVVYDLLAGQFVSFAIEPYRKNDQKAAPDLVLLPGDLVLRDRGYLTRDEIRRHRQAGADCIYRHQPHTTYLDPADGKPLDLQALLDRHGHLDFQVWLNNPERTSVRLVAAPVDAQTANHRRRKHRQEAKGHAPSAELLRLLGWTIFVTTVPAARASFADLLAMYRLRWRIEILFKAWKSNLSFAALHQVSRRQLHALLLARLTTIVIIERNIYRPALARIEDDYQKQVSILKLTRYLARHPTRIHPLVAALATTRGPQHPLKAIAKYCCYDRRRRPAFPHLKDETFDTWALG